jgi:hypothetical protein
MCDIIRKRSRVCLIPKIDVKLFMRKPTCEIGQATKALLSFERLFTDFGLWSQCAKRHSANLHCLGKLFFRVAGPLGLQFLN